MVPMRLTEASLRQKVSADPCERGQHMSATARFPHSCSAATRYIARKARPPGRSGEVADLGLGHHDNAVGRKGAHEIGVVAHKEERTRVGEQRLEHLPNR